jgi:hypothetical protein
MSRADFLTIDVYEQPSLNAIRWKKAVRDTISRGVDGLRAATVNHANNGTRALVPRLFPAGRALVAAWESPEAAATAWTGPLAVALDGPGRFSLDGEIVRVRVATPGDHWHGWTPSDEGAEPLEKDEPMIAIVHGIVRKGHLRKFVHHNMHAASRAAHHPGHRGSVDISSQLPFEHTSISLWKSLRSAQDYAYAPGGHSFAMKHSLQTNMHRVGCFLQVRPLGSSGALGIESPPFPELPPAVRG